jgi:hypothetical protein
VFLILMVIGLVGLAMMAIPAFGKHGHAGGAHHGLGHGTGHAGLLGHGHAGAHVGHAGVGHAGVGGGHGGGAGGGLGAVKGGLGAVKGGLAAVKGGTAKAGGPADGDLVVAGPTRFLPSPRAVFSVLALYGAFGNALEHAGHLSTLLAALAAVVPTLLVERFAVTPLWNLLLRFQAAPSAKLEELVLSEARAETPFRNGKGLVSVVREGRRVQLSARIADAEASHRIEVGDRLLVEDVDAAKERLTVSVPKE